MPNCVAWPLRRRPRHEQRRARPDDDRAARPRPRRAAARRAARRRRAGSARRRAAATARSRARRRGTCRGWSRRPRSAPAVGRDPRVHARDRRVGEHAAIDARRAPDRHLRHDRHARGVGQHELERRRAAVQRRAAAAAVARSPLELATAAAGTARAVSPPSVSGWYDRVVAVGAAARCRLAGSSRPTAARARRRPPAQPSSACTTTQLLAVAAPRRPCRRARACGLALVEREVARASARHSWNASTAWLETSASLLAVRRDRGVEHALARLSSVGHEAALAPVRGVGRERGLSLLTRQRTMPNVARLGA